MGGGEIEFGGHTYRLGTLSALEQFHVMRRLAPVLGGAMGGQEENDGGSMIAKMLGALADMSDADCEYIFAKCLKDCTRKQDGDSGWARIWKNGQLMFSDVGAKGLFFLTRATLEDAIGDFFPAGPSDLSLGAD